MKKTTKVIVKETHLDFDGLNERQQTNMIVVHHTGNPTDDDLSAAEIHDSHKAQGWAGIGYHYVIRKDGTIERGRPRWAVGAHAYGRNRDTVGIHVCGNFEIARPTPEQLNSLSALIGELCNIYNLTAAKNVVVGHRDLMATACPGRKLYEKMQTIRGNAEWYRLH